MALAVLFAHELFGMVRGGEGGEGGVEDSRIVEPVDPPVPPVTRDLPDGNTSPVTGCVYRAVQYATGESGAEGEGEMQREYDRESPIGGIAFLLYAMRTYITIRSRSINFNT